MWPFQPLVPAAADLLAGGGGGGGDVFIEGLDRIESGVKAVTAAGLDGVLQNTLEAA